MSLCRCRFRGGFITKLLAAIMMKVTNLQALLFGCCVAYQLQFTIGIRNTSDGLPLWLTFNASRVGVVDLPAIDRLHPPAFCTDVRAACGASTRHEYNVSFALLEARYAKCGDYGWELTGHAHGSENSVIFKVDPCGLPVAIKAPQIFPFECNNLIALSSDSVARECPGCLNKGYYYSGVRRCQADVAAVLQGQSYCFYL